MHLPSVVEHARQQRMQGSFAAVSLEKSLARSGLRNRPMAPPAYLVVAGSVRFLLLKVPLRRRIEVEGVVLLRVQRLSQVLPVSWILIRGSSWTNR